MTFLSIAENMHVLLIKIRKWDIGLTPLEHDLHEVVFWAPAVIGKRAMEKGKDKCPLVFGMVLVFRFRRSRELVCNEASLQ